MLVQAILAALLGGRRCSPPRRLKLLDRTGTAVAAESFGLRGRAARSAWLALAALEAGLAAGVLAGATAAAWAAAAAFVALRRRAGDRDRRRPRGAPCGCFGARGRISWGSVARAALLAAAAALLAGLGAGARHAAAACSPRSRRSSLAGAIVAARAAPRRRARHRRRGPAAGHDAWTLGEGVRLALFTSAGCRLCRSLVPRAERLGAKIIDEAAGAAQWSAANVPGAPFAVALAADGTVLAKGTVNTRAQLQSVAARGAGATRPSAPARRRTRSAARGAASCRPPAPPSRC